MKKLTEAQFNEAVLLYQSGFSLNEVGQRFGVTRGALISRMNTRGIARRRRGGIQKYELNHEAFQELTPEACYWLGFLAADGTYAATEGHADVVQIALGAKDAYHLKRLRIFLGSTHPVVIKQRPTDSKFADMPYAFFRVRSQPLYDAAKIVGVGGKKPFRKPIAVLANSRDFWRGVIDGDGSLTLNGRGARITMYAHPPMMESWMNFCEEYHLLGATKPLQKEATLQQLTITGQRARRLVSYLYQPGDVALDRKAIIAQEIRALPDVLPDFRTIR